MRAAALLLLAVAAHAEGEPEWIVTLSNGDTLHCRLEAIEALHLVVRWAIAPDEPLKLDVKAVQQVARVGEGGVIGEPPENMDMLRLIDDSVLYGRAAAISPKGIEFEVPQVGRLAIPAPDILDLHRGRPVAQIPDAADGEFGVVLRSGVALAGKLSSAAGGGLVLEGAGITATIDDASLSVLVFPSPDIEEENPDAPAVQGIEVKLRNGSVVGGKDPALEGGALRLRVGGVEARLPVQDIAAISFRDYAAGVGRANLRRLLAWGRWADPAEEFRRTVDIVKAEAGGRWKVAETSTDRFDATFRRQLLTARTLLIPEMENLKGPSPDAAELKPLLDAFLQSGGNVVICGVQQPPQLQWLREAALVDLESLGQVDGSEVSFTAAAGTAGKGLKTFQAVNATTAYAIRSKDAFAIAETAGKCVVVGRRVGRGLVIVVGLDYYMTNDGASRLLGNVIQMR